MQYKVKLTFKYNDKRYMPGDIWEPIGAKWDNSIKQHFVYVVDEPSPKKKVTKRNGRTSSK